MTVFNSPRFLYNYLIFKYSVTLLLLLLLLLFLNISLRLYVIPIYHICTISILIYIYIYFCAQPKIKNFLLGLLLFSFLASYISLNHIIHRAPVFLLVLFYFISSCVIIEMIILFVCSNCITF